MNTQLSTNSLDKSEFTPEQIEQCRVEHKKAPKTSGELTGVIVSGPGGLGVQYWRPIHIMCGIRIASDKSTWIFEDYL